MGKPDTNQASELYELCKEVYEKTGWEAPETYKAEDGNPENDWQAYDTDYLLEKLPSGQRVVKVDEAYYVANNVQGLTDVNSDGESALVALLKFTLFLDKEGLL